MQINANFKMKGFVGLMNSCGFYKQCGLMEVSASNPFILKLHLSLMRKKKREDAFLKHLFILATQQVINHIWELIKIVEDTIVIENIKTNKKFVIDEKTTCSKINFY